MFSCFVTQNTSSISAGRIEHIYASVIKKHYADYMGHIFEQMCREYLFLYAEVFGKGNKYYYYIFSKSGFTNGLKELAEKEEVRLVSLEDMYN